jgi:hypothetical protein
MFRGKNRKLIAVLSSLLFIIPKTIIFLSFLTRSSIVAERHIARHAPATPALASAQRELLTLVAKHTYLAVIQMQEELLLAANVESKPLPDGALPRRAEFLIESVLNRGGGALVIAVGLELVEGGGANLHGLVSHFGGHVRVLCGEIEREGERERERERERE